MSEYQRVIESKIRFVNSDTLTLNKTEAFMIIVLKPETTKEQINHIIDKIKGLGLAVHISKGKERTILGVIGD